MKSLAVVSPIVTLAVLLAYTAPVFALAGTLDSPGVAFSGDYPKDARDKVMAALTRKDCKFLGGEFVKRLVAAAQSRPAPTRVAGHLRRAPQRPSR
jgi:hypothetical protein